MNTATIDLWVGIFVTIGFGAIVFLALKVGNLDVAGDASPSYHLDANFDNIGGLKLRAPVKAAGVIVGRVESIRLDPKTYEAVVDAAHRQRLPVLEGHHRLDPHLRAAGRGLHRPRGRRRPAMLADGAAHRQDAVGGRAREAHRPVPLRQGLERPTRPPNEKTSCARRRARLLSAAAVRLRAPPAGALDDPFEAVQPRDVRDQRAARSSTSPSRSREAYVDDRAELHPHRPSRNYVNNIDDLFSVINGAAAGQVDKIGNDMGRVMINTRASASAA